MKIVLLCILIAFGFYVFTWYLESRSLYFPIRPVRDTPRQVGLDYEDVFLKTSDDYKLHGWYLASGERHVILFFHGNGGNISHRLDKILFLKEAGLDILIIDYRGYGRSNGAPSEAGLYRDAKAAYDYLVLEKKIKPESIVLYGESLGGAVAADLAAKHPVGALITEETFTSVPEMARVIYPIIPSWFIRSRYDALSKIKKVTCPKLFFHSVDDEIVPFKLGQKLMEAAPEPKVFVQLRGGHNEAFWHSKDIWLEGIRTFLETL